MRVALSTDLMVGARDRSPSVGRGKQTLRRENDGLRARSAGQLRVGWRCGLMNMREASS